MSVTDIAKHVSRIGELKKIFPFLETASDNMQVGDWRVFDDLLSAVGAHPPDICRCYATYGSAAASSKDAATSHVLVAKPKLPDMCS
eukprot:3571359-Rhodomonas_salina.6